MQDVLLDLAVHPLVIHNKEISPGTVGLRTNEQADTYVSLLSTNIKAYNKAYCRYFRTMCDTMFLRWKLSLLVKSISYRRFASLTVEDEHDFYFPSPHIRTRRPTLITSSRLRIQERIVGP